MYCAGCKKLIQGSNRIHVMGKYYHPVGFGAHFKSQEHFVCFSCQTVLQPSFYKAKTICVDGYTALRSFCNSCAQRLENSLCPNCNQALYDLVAMFHVAHV